MNSDGGTRANEDGVMLNLRIPWKLLLLGAALAMPVVVVLAQDPVQEIKWRHDYSLARKEAQDKGLPLVIDFGTKTCFYCAKLDQTTFRDPRIVSVMNERFVPLKIDADVEADLASRLHISNYPTILLAGADGKILSTMVGYKDAREFQENLQRTLASVAAPDWMQRDCSWRPSGLRTATMPAPSGLSRRS